MCSYNILIQNATQNVPTKMFLYKTLERERERERERGVYSSDEVSTMYKSTHKSSLVTWLTRLNSISVLAAFSP